MDKNMEQLSGTPIEIITPQMKARDAITELSNELDKKRNEIYALFEENQELIEENDRLTEKLLHAVKDNK